MGEWSEWNIIKDAFFLLFFFDNVGDQRDRIFESLLSCAHNHNLVDNVSASAGLFGITAGVTIQWHRNETLPLRISKQAGTRQQFVWPPHRHIPEAGIIVETLQEFASITIDVVHDHIVQRPNYRLFEVDFLAVHDAAKRFNKLQPIRIRSYYFLSKC